MPSRRLIKDPERYKTVLCATWVQTGECPYGRKCQFAHGKEELRTRTAPPLSSTVAQPQAGAGMRGLQPGLPNAPMSLWGQPSHAGHCMPTGLSMPPLPPGPPPSSSHLERGLLLSPQMGGGPVAAAPPLPPGPPPAALAPDYSGALAQQLANATANLHAVNVQRHAAGQMAQLNGTQHGGIMLDRSPALMAMAPAPAPSAAPPLPSAILHGHSPLGIAPQQLPASLPPTMPGMPPSALPAGMTAGMAAGMMAAAPSAEPPRQPPLPPTMMAAAPSAEAPRQPPLPGVQPAGGAAAKGNLPTPLCVSDELASFAMRCAVADKELRDQTNCFHPDFHPSQLWSPLKFSEAASKGVGGGEGTLGPRRLWESESGSGGAGTPVGGAADGDKLDSPIDPHAPGLSKRDVSFSTMSVRRAVSFVFADTIEENSPSPMYGEVREALNKSPHTAIAA